MRVAYRSVTASVLAVLWLLSGCQTTQTSPIDQTSTQEGLVKVDIKGMDAVYKKPQANLTGYDKILLRPVEVAFSKHWKPEDDSALYQMNEPDRQKIKQVLFAGIRSDNGSSAHSPFCHGSRRCSQFRGF